MPLGQSIPFAAPAGILAGIVAGEITRLAAKELGRSEEEQRIYAQLGHFLASSGVSWTINTLVAADVTGGVVTVGTAGAGAVYHPEVFRIFEELAKSKPA